MRLVKVTTYKVGLVYVEGIYKRVLTEGWNYVRNNEEVRIVDTSSPFNIKKDYDIMKKDTSLMQMLEIVKISDSKVGLLYDGENFKEVLRPGIYALWKGVKDYKLKIEDLFDTEISKEIDRVVLNRLKLENYIRAYEIMSYEEGFLFIDGKYIKRLEP
jgi:hypothetical protein